ncbi:MAG TPA: SigB/SigF/SigG family RNA polymerase sigma factor [Candidatus Dormibacteraeota bacterium]
MESTVQDEAKSKSDALAQRAHRGEVVAERADRVETTELFARWQQDGDPRARQELALRFLPLARKLARRYSGAHEPFDDLLQVASLGLVKAIDRFDVSRGTAFSSFAVPTILGELKRYFRDLGWSVHVPRGAQELALRVEDARQKLTTKTGRPPSVQDLAQYLELSIEDVLEALETAGAHHTASLDSPRDDGEEESGTLADAFGQVDESYELVEARATIAAAADHLGPRERQVLVLRFVEDLTQSQIASMTGVSQMQVSRILRRALEQLRELTEVKEPPGV